MIFTISFINQILLRVNVTVIQARVNVILIKCSYFNKNIFANFSVCSSSLFNKVQQAKWIDVSNHLDKHKLDLKLFETDLDHILNSF